MTKDIVLLAWVVNREWLPEEQVLPAVRRILHRQWRKYDQDCECNR